MRDDEAIATSVVLLMKTALAPVLERLAVAETRLSQLAVQEQTVGELRERLVTVETKSAAAVVIPPAVEPVAPVDVTPFLERIAAAEASIALLATSGQAVDAFRERLVTVETKTALPAPPVDFGDVPARLSAVELKLEFKAQTVDAIVGTLADHTKDVTAVRERLAVIETRPQLAGPKGDDGTPGKNGIDGAAGIPGLAYQGVYQEGKSYDVGHVVTWAGSTWHANESTTAKPGEGSKAWTLMVKRGRDGRDGRDALDPVPVVRVGR